MINILVTGAEGQLGSEINAIAKNYSNYNFIFTDVEQLDICNNQEVEAFFKENSIDVIVNCAAYTAVDKAETDKEKAFLLNAVAIDFLIDAALANNASLIQISTDYVFDGTKYTPYSEEDPTFPSGIYGKTKEEGEKLILYAELNAIIIRTSWLYSVYGNNFVKTMLKLGKERDELNVVYDQVGTPTNAADLAKAILDIVPKVHQTQNNPIQEIYHYSNEGVASWYDFAKAIFRHKNYTCKVNAVDSSMFPTPAKRPPYSVMDKSKIKNDYNITIPNWYDSLCTMLNKL